MYSQASTRGSRSAMRSRQARVTASHVVLPLPMAWVISSAVHSFSAAAGRATAVVFIVSIRPGAAFADDLAPLGDIGLDHLGETGGRLMVGIAELRRELVAQVRGLQ